MPSVPVSELFRLMETSDTLPWSCGLDRADRVPAMAGPLKWGRYLLRHGAWHPGANRAANRPSRRVRAREHHGNLLQAAGSPSAAPAPAVPHSARAAMARTRAKVSSGGLMEAAAPTRRARIGPHGHRTGRRRASRASPTSSGRPVQCASASRPGRERRRSGPPRASPRASAHSSPLQRVALPMAASHRQATTATAHAVSMVRARPGAICPTVRSSRGAAGTRATERTAAATSRRDLFPPGAAGASKARADGADRAARWLTAWPLRDRATGQGRAARG